MGLLENKIGLVTGAGQGIGRAIALAYAREGARVLVADYNADTGGETVQLIEAAGGSARFAHADVSNEDSVRAMVDAALEAFGRLDIACNSAAVTRGSGPIHDTKFQVLPPRCLIGSSGLKSPVAISPVSS